MKHERMLGWRLDRARQSGHSELARTERSNILLWPIVAGERWDALQQLCGEDRRFDATFRDPVTAGSQKGPEAYFASDAADWEDDWRDDFYEEDAYFQTMKCRNNLIMPSKQLKRHAPLGKRLARR